MIAQVALSGLIYAIDRPYAYQIPEGMTVRPGMRVMVPFSRADRETEGMVLELADELPPGAESVKLKPILAILDPEPVMDALMLRLAAFLRERYFCTFYDAIRVILPAGVWLKSKERYALGKLPKDYEQKLKDRPEALRLLQAVSDAGGALDANSLFRLFPERETFERELRYLCQKRYLKAHTELLQKQSDKTEPILQLAVDPEQALDFCQKKRRAAPMQASVMELLATVGEISMKELSYFTGAKTGTIKALQRIGFLTVTQQEVLRRTQLSPLEQAPEFRLNEEQDAVVRGLKRDMGSDTPGVALLYGVTGSGKTAVYIHLIRHCLEQGRSAMLLVPEIALTPQLLSLFSACFPDQIAVLHSSLRVGERYDAYKRIQRGEARVVIGTRSAVFAPIVRPGLLVLDEEQEHTYKSENSPRYHAREVAIYRGSREGALVLLGSATPSIETMYRAKQGLYRLYTLSSRFNGMELPKAALVDMRQELQNGNQTAVSGPLAQAIRERMARKEKTILLLNRRGGNRLVMCVDCGSVPQCPRCSVNLTYHMANDRLMCHYCGYAQPMLQTCPSCGGHLKRVGVGTQQLQFDLEQMFPDREILRMDADTISATCPHEKLLSRFAEEDIPVLIGTQMVAKGLNFEDVTLVGVVDADASLYLDHFRASETTFSLITQVVGRSGRGEKSGQALIQTLTPKNSVLRLAAEQDYNAFYESEIHLREVRSFPPFYDMIQIGFVGSPEEHVRRCAQVFARTLWQHLERSGLNRQTADLFGPAPAPIVKINNKYRYRLTLLCKNSRQLRQILSRLLQSFAKWKEAKSVTAFVDVNGYE